MTGPVVSAVMPTYNRSTALEITLEAWERQRGMDRPWELVVVDDGSTDDTRAVAEARDPDHPFVFVSRDHAGRAAARNAGLRRARGEVAVFCDSDRPPGNRFLASHLAAHDDAAGRVVVGDVQELYFSDLGARRDLLLDAMEEDFAPVRRLARRPGYARAVYEMFDASGETRHAAPWIAFLSGNVSVRIEHLRRIGGFDESFVKWGFEHFELGYRLHRAGLEFVREPGARNYHLAHRREDDFYRRRIRASLDRFLSKHPHRAVELLEDFLFGRISLQEYHLRVAGEDAGADPPGLPEEPVYFRQLTV